MTTPQIQNIEVGRIKVKSNPRGHFDDEKILGIAQSFQEVGQQQPIQVDPELNILDGELRYRAALKAGMKTVKVIVLDRAMTPGELLQFQLVANLQRDDLTALDKARAIGRMMTETGWSATQTASKLGLSNASVSRSLALLSLPDTILQKVESGEVSPSAAYELAKVNDPARQAELAGQAAAGQLTRDGVSGALKAHKRTGKDKPAATPARVTAHLSDGRAVSVAGHGLSLDVFITILEDVLARARQARPKGLALGTFLKVLRDQSQK